jgi:hypothetical protein
MVPSSDSSQLLFVKPSALQFSEKLWTRQPAYEDAWFPGTETKSTDKDGLQQNLEAGTPTIEKQQQQGNLPVNKG